MRNDDLHFLAEYFENGWDRGSVPIDH